MMKLNNDMDLCIIIPAYNAKETIDLTLNSIKNQKLSIKFEVLLVNDCSNYDYSEFVNKYKNYYNIREIKTKINSGPGVARQLGIDSSNSKYIIFIDSDDCFYNENSVAKIYKKIESEYLDIVVGNFILESGSYRIVKKYDFIWLHGKIYRRDFFVKYNIRFNDSRSNEDSGFNSIIKFMKPKVAYLEDIIYIYKNNANSITRKDNYKYRFNGIKGFCYNMNWAVDQALSRNVSKHEIIVFLVDVLSELYVYYLYFYEKEDVNKILKWGYKIFQKYLKYKNIIEKNDANKIVKNKIFQLMDFYINKHSIITFYDFLDKFKNM